MEKGFDEEKLKREIAKSLLSIEAVFLRPIYCDNRLTLTAPEVRTKIEEGLASIVKEYYPECELLMGTSTAGIAHAAITGHMMGLPMGYVRGSKKDHGRTNMIEGRLEPGQKTVVIEDLISTGGSVIKTVEALRDAGADVLGVASIFTYGMKKSGEMLGEHDVENHSLSDLDHLVDVAAETGYIDEKERDGVLAFRDDPIDEAWMHMI